MQVIETSRWSSNEILSRRRERYTSEETRCLTGRRTPVTGSESMFARILEKLTGKDDLERVAYKEDLELLNDYLKTRRLLFPKKPRHFLDAATFTQEQLMEMIEQESKELDGDQIELWILNVEGKKRLPAFSSQKAMEAFSTRMSQDLNKVFSLGCFEALLSDVAKQADVDFVDLNLFSKKSWEIGVRKQT